MDWMGNKAEQKWSFFADSRIQPVKVTTPSEQGAGDEAGIGIMPGMEADPTAPPVFNRRSRSRRNNQAAPAAPVLP
jgi:hypothetical protein